VTQHRTSIPIAAIEGTKYGPTKRVILDRAMILHVLSGQIQVATAMGSVDLLPGHAFSLGAGFWFSLHPKRVARIWALYIDEIFLRDQLAWCLPDHARLAPQVRGANWDGSPILVEHGLEALERMEPYWRQMSELKAPGLSLELASTRVLALFGKTIEMSLAALLLPSETGSPTIPGSLSTLRLSPVRGDPRHVDRAVNVLHLRMHERWTVSKLAVELSISRALT
jgi:hypothetical protein